MPTYDYRCSDCQHQFEFVHKITETPQVPCPKCGGVHTQRLISATAFHLKGSGWYKTDYASSSSAPATDTAGGKSEAPSSASAASDGSKSDGAPASANPPPSSSSGEAASAPAPSTPTSGSSTS